MALSEAIRPPSPSVGNNEPDVGAQGASADDAPTQGSMARPARCRNQEGATSTSIICLQLLGTCGALQIGVCSEWLVCRVMSSRHVAAANHALQGRRKRMLPGCPGRAHRAPGPGLARHLAGRGRLRASGRPAGVRHPGLAGRGSPGRPHPRPPARRVYRPAVLGQVGTAGVDGIARPARSVRTLGFPAAATRSDPPGFEALAVHGRTHPPHPHRPADLPSPSKRSLIFAVSPEGAASLRPPGAESPMRAVPPSQ